MILTWKYNAWQINDKFFERLPRCFCCAFLFIETDRKVRNYNMWEHLSISFNPTTCTSWDTDQSAVTNFVSLFSLKIAKSQTQMMPNSRAFMYHFMETTPKVAALKVNRVSRLLKPLARSKQADTSTLTEKEPSSVHTTVQAVFRVVLVSSLTRIWLWKPSTRHLMSSVWRDFISRRQMVNSRHWGLSCQGSLFGQHLLPLKTGTRLKLSTVLFITPLELWAFRYTTS